MKIAFSILFFTILEFSGIAQPTEFNTTFSIGINPIFIKLVEIPGSYYIMGQSNNPNKKFLFSKANKSDLSISNFFYGDSTTGYYLPFDFKKQGNNNFVVTGGYEKNYTGVPVLIKIDTLFNIIKDTLLSYKTMDIKNIEFLGSNIIFGGSTIYANNWDTLCSLSGGYHATNMLFWKTSNEFNHLNHSSIGLFCVSELTNSFSSGFDNNFLLGGTTRANQDIDWYLVNVDTSGQIQGQYYYGDPNLDDGDGIVGISKGSDSTYFLAGGIPCYYDTINNEFYAIPQVVKINRQFNTIWEKTFGIPYIGKIAS